MRASANRRQVIESQDSNAFSESLMCVNGSCSLMKNINDEQCYETIVGLFLQLTSESGASKIMLQQLRLILLKAKGLHQHQLMNYYQNNVESSTITIQRQESYNTHQRMSSIREQSNLLTTLQNAIVQQRKKELQQFLFKKWTRQKATQLAPLISAVSINRKEQFKRKVKEKFCAYINTNPYAASQQPINLLKDIYQPDNQCYKTVRSYIHLKTMFGHSYDEELESYCPIFNIIFDKSEKFIISGGEDGLIKVWSRQNGQLLGNLKGHTDYINKIQTSKCNKYLLTTAADGVRFFQLSTLSSLGGWRTSSIIDITSILQKNSSTFIFCDQKNLYLLPENMMLKHCKDQLKPANLKCFNFQHLVNKSNANVNTITISRNNQLILLGFDNGEIILLHYSDLLQCREIDENYKLVARFVMRAHWQDIIEIKWNKDQIHFVTGGKQGNCSLWQYKNNSAPALLKTVQAAKTFNRRKKKVFACNYICWNSTETHFIAGFKELVDDEDQNRGDGDIVVYSLLTSAITCQYSEEIGKIGSIRALDTHPFYPNIALICQGNGKIILLDIYLKIIVNIFEEKGYHILHSQFSLIPADCRFSKDGLSFLVSTQYGSLSLYGYDIKSFFQMCPNQQFLQSDFEKFILQEGTMRALPISMQAIIDINSLSRGLICNIHGNQYCKLLRINMQNYWHNHNQNLENINQHISKVKIDQEFLSIVKHNLHEASKYKEFYSKNMLEVQNNRQSIIYEQKQKQYKLIMDYLQQKFVKNTGLHHQKTQIQNTKLKNDLNNSISQRGRKLKRMSGIGVNYHQADYTEEFNYDDQNQESFKLELEDKLGEQSEEEQQYCGESEQLYKNKLIKRNRNNTNRYSTRIRKQQQYGQYSFEQQLFLDQQQDQDQYKHKKNIKRTRQRSISQDIEDMLENQQFRHTNGSKKIKKHLDYSSDNMEKENYRNQERYIKQQSSQNLSQICKRCKNYQSFFTCRKCKAKSYCNKCYLKRGKQQNNSFICFQCIFLENHASQDFSNISEDKLRITRRSQECYVPQIGDQVRYFFQGYEDFVNTNIKHLNKRVIDQISQFELMIHENVQQLLYSPLCKVKQIMYYLPVLSESVSFGRRMQSQTKLVQMFIQLEVQQSLNKDNQHKKIQFWVFYLPGYDCLLRQEQYQYLVNNNVMQSIQQNGLIKHKGQELQVIAIGALQEVFPYSLWKCITVRKTEGKRLRGRANELEKKISIWNIDEIIPECAYKCQVSTKDSSKLLKEIQNIVADQYSEEFQWFYDYVDIEMYPAYRYHIQLGICLKAIKDRLKHVYYRSYDSLEADLNLVLNNCCRFNGKESYLTTIAENLINKLRNCCEKLRNVHMQNVKVQCRNKILQENTVKKSNKRQENRVQNLRKEETLMNRLNRHRVQKPSKYINESQQVSQSDSSNSEQFQNNHQVHDKLRRSTRSRPLQLLGNNKQKPKNYITRRNRKQ